MAVSASTKRKGRTKDVLKDETGQVFAWRFHTFRETLRKLDGMSPGDVDALAADLAESRADREKIETALAHGCTPKQLVEIFL